MKQRARATTSLPLSVAVLLGALAVGVSTAGAGCTNGTTPVCDDAGSCLIAPAVGDGGASFNDGGGDAGGGGGGQDSPVD